MDAFLSILGIVVVIAGAQFVLGPILVLFTLRQSGRPYLFPYDPNFNPPPPDVFAHFTRVWGELGPHGFEVAAYLRGAMAGNDVNIMLLVNRREGIVGYAGALDAGLIKNRYVEFYADFDNGAEINASNVRTPPGTFAVKPGKLVVHFPNFQNSAELLRAFQALLARRSPAARRVVPPTNDAIAAHFVEGPRRDYEYQVKAGYFRLNRGTDTYHPTIKGACLMTWKLCVPVMQIRKLRARSRRKQLMRELHLERTV